MLSATSQKVAKLVKAMMHQPDSASFELRQRFKDNEKKKKMAKGYNIYRRWATT